MNRLTGCLMTVLLACLLTGCAEQKTEEQELTRVVLWHYYNDSQKEQLDQMIEEYNRTAGAEAGIEVEAFGQGTVDALSEKVGLILNHSTNEIEAMDMFLAYRDITIQILEADRSSLVDYRDYFTPEELSFYQDDYLQEGYFGEELYLLPIVKSTELLLMNQNRLDEFWEANPQFGAQELATWEGLMQTAQAYYEWTDRMTPAVPHDGQAFIGMDVPANYFIVQNNALGNSIYTYEDGQVTFHLDEDVTGRLFDTWYIPYSRGYYGSYGRFRSDDLRQSLLAGYIGSSSSISYFPSELIDTDGTQKQVRLGIYEYPYYTDGVKTAVQQGAGAAVVAGDPAKEAACIHFLKWLTQDKGVEYAASLSYMPVGKQGLSAEQEAMITEENNKNGMKIGMRQSSTYRMVHGFDFPKGYEARQALTAYITDCLTQGREEFLSYLEQGMSEEEAEKAMDYQQKRTAFYAGIVEIFQEAE